MRFLSWLVGLALLALLALFCVNRNAPRIEAELTADAQAALTTAGLDPELVSLDGRDACLPTIPSTAFASLTPGVVKSPCPGRSSVPSVRRTRLSSKAR